MVTQIAIYGAGGFSREVAWLVQSCNQAEELYQVVCFIDDNEETHGTLLNGIPVMGLAEARLCFPQARVVGGVGSPQVRRYLMEKAAAAGFHFETIVHPRTEISPWVEIGAGTVICAGNMLTTNVVIGQHVQINLDCTIGHDVVMEDYATLAPGVHVSGCVHLEKRSYIGTGAAIINGTRDNPIVIGEDAVVGAGACVIKSVPAGVTVVGVPARPLGCKAADRPDTTRPGSSKVVVYGAGEHGKTLIAAIEAEGRHEIVGLLDDDESKHGATFYGYQVLGGREQARRLQDAGLSRAVVAVGDNLKRAELAQFLKENGFQLVPVTHPTATILRGARVGEGTVVLPGAFVGADATVGAGCIVGATAGVGHDAIVGSWVQLCPKSWLGGHARVGDYSFVGLGGVVLPYVTVGRHTVVGANAAVNRDLPDHVTAVGVPARILKRRPATT